MTNPLLVAFARAALTTAAGVGLWRLYASVARRDRRVAVIVGAGFLLRAVCGQLLFWISWLRLPLAPSLQLGDGFWFFASDGPTYLASASALAAGGPSAVLGATAIYPSRVFVQVLAVAVTAFGDVASIALLVNGAAYLATCALACSLDRRGRGSADAPRPASVPCLAALAAISFGPGTLLWSLQLLKDTVFLLLITGLVGAAAWWQALWRADARRAGAWARVAACACAMFAITYALGGIRWYFAAIVCAAAAAFLFLVAIAARPRVPALAGAAALLILLTQAARLGGDDDMPAGIRRLLDPRPAAAAVWRPASVSAYLAEARSGFERTPGNTAILPGAALAMPGASARADAAASTVAPSHEPRYDSKSPAWSAVWRAAAGAAALFVPRAAGQALGLIRVGGGRGLWLFAEIDTLAFDAVLLFAAIYSMRALRARRSRVTPLFVLLVLIFLMTAAPLAYTVNNFGTLFRLRQMLYLIAALLPSTLAAREKEPAAARIPAGESSMRTYLAVPLVGLALLLPVRSAAAQTLASERPADAAAIRAHIESIFKAFIDKDHPKLEATHGKEWRGFTTYSGRVIRGLDDYMKSATFPPGTPKGQGMVGYRLSDFDIVFYGDTAVVCFVADLDVVYGTDKGTQRLTLLDVYHKDPGGWIQVASNTSLHPDEVERRQGELRQLNDAERASLLSAREAVWRAWFAGDVDAFAKLVPPELLAIEPHGERFGTRDSIIAESRDFASSGGKLVKLVFPRTEIQAYGSTAVLYTTFELELMTGGRAETQRGTATEFFVQQDGRWINTGWQLAPAAK